MKLSKKHWVMLIIGVAALILVIYFLNKKKSVPAAESSYDPNLLILGSESGFSWPWSRKKVSNIKLAGKQNCGTGECATLVTYDFWSDSNPPQHTKVTVSECLPCKGSSSSSSNFAAPRVAPGVTSPVSGPMGKGICYRTVNNVTTEVPCANLPKEVKAAVLAAG